MCRRGTVADGEVCKSSVRSGTAYRTEVVVAGSTEHVQVGLSATCVGTSLDSIYKVVVNLHGNGVGIFVIVAEERCVVADVLAHLFFAFEVPGTCIEYLIHGVAMLFKDMFLYRCEAVGDGSQSCTLYICSVVSGTTAVVVLAFLDTVVDIQTEEGGRSIEREHTFDVVVN